MKILIGRTITNNLGHFKKHKRLLQKKYIIQKQHCLKEQYYKMSLHGYEWTKKKHLATVFYGEQHLHREIQSTTMQYENYYKIVRL